MNKDVPQYTGNSVRMYSLSRTLKTSGRLKVYVCIHDFERPYCCLIWTWYTNEVSSSGTVVGRWVRTQVETENVTPLFREPFK